VSTKLLSERWARPIRAALLLFGLALILVGTAVPGAYTIDENNYLVSLLSLRSGGLALPGTADLRPSTELYWFDPLAMGRAAQTPLVSTVPPLWAFLALPFSFFGWYGLVALNVLALLTTACLVFWYAGAVSNRRATSWIAASAVFVGGFSIEYAQGVWPHCLTMALCTASVVLVAHARRRNRIWPALVAGTLVGLAMGARYQNIVFGLAVGLSLLLFGQRRLARAAVFSLGLAGPILACSLLNHARLGWYSPISKGPGYVGLQIREGGHSGRMLDVAWALYAKVVDFSSHPPMGEGAAGQGANRWLWSADPVLGAYIVHGAVKKALLQSAPWLAISLVVLALAWRRRRDEDKGFGDEERALSVVFGSVLLFFGLAAFTRQDGLCANQRYLLELVPLGALALAFGVDRLELPRPALLAGAVLGALPALVVFWPGLDPALRVRGLLIVPLVFAAAGALAMLAHRIEVSRIRLPTFLMAALAGAGLSWAGAVHLADDLPASFRRRLDAASLAERWSTVLPHPPERAALFVYFGGRDASAPLHLDRDLILVDPWLDSARDAPLVADDLLRSGRRVFIDLAAVPPAVVTRIRGAHPVRVALPGKAPILELLP
jgi:hypothetical protein